MEREAGHSVHVARRQLTTARHDVTLLDVPGDPRYGKAVTVSVSQADCALVVVDVDQLASDPARGGYASTREHALTAYTLGVKQVICAVNKVRPVYCSPTASPLSFSPLLTQQQPEPGSSAHPLVPIVVLVHGLRKRRLYQV